MIIPPSYCYTFSSAVSSTSGSLLSSDSGSEFASGILLPAARMSAVSLPSGISASAVNSSGSSQVVSKLAADVLASASSVSSSTAPVASSYVQTVETASYSEEPSPSAAQASKKKDSDSLESNESEELEEPLESDESEELEELSAKEKQNQEKNTHEQLTMWHSNPSFGRSIYQLDTEKKDPVGGLGKIVSAFLRNFQNEIYIETKIRRRIYESIGQAYDYVEAFNKKSTLQRTLYQILDSAPWELNIPLDGKSPIKKILLLLSQIYKWHQKCLEVLHREKNPNVSLDPYFSPWTQEQTHVRMQFFEVLTFTSVSITLKKLITRFAKENFEKQISTTWPSSIISNGGNAMFVAKWKEFLKLRDKIQELSLEPGLWMYCLTKKNQNDPQLFFVSTRKTITSALKIISTVGTSASASSSSASASSGSSADSAGVRTRIKSLRASKRKQQHSVESEESEELEEPPAKRKRQQKRTTHEQLSIWNDNPFCERSIYQLDAEKADPVNSLNKIVNNFFRYFQDEIYLTDDTRSKISFYIKLANEYVEAHNKESTLKRTLYQVLDSTPWELDISSAGGREYLKRLLLLLNRIYKWHQKYLESLHQAETPALSVEKYFSPWTQEQTNLRMKLFEVLTFHAHSTRLTNIITAFQHKQFDKRSPAALPSSILNSQNNVTFNRKWQEFLELYSKAEKLPSEPGVWMYCLTKNNQIDPTLLFASTTGTIIPALEIISAVGASASASSAPIAVSASASASASSSASSSAAARTPINSLAVALLMSSSTSASSASITVSASSSLASVSSAAVVVPVQSPPSLMATGIDSTVQTRMSTERAFWDRQAYHLNHMLRVQKMHNQVMHIKLNGVLTPSSPAAILSDALNKQLIIIQMIEDEKEEVSEHVAAVASASSPASAGSAAAVASASSPASAGSAAAVASASSPASAGSAAAVASASSPASAGSAAAVASASSPASAGSAAAGAPTGFELNAMLDIFKSMESQTYTDLCLVLEAIFKDCKNELQPQPLTDSHRKAVMEYQEDMLCFFHNIRCMHE